MFDLTKLQHQHELVRLTIADQAFSGYIRSVQDDQAVMILVSKTGHPDGWLWLNTDKIQAIDSQTPDLALQASFIDIYRHRQPSFDPQQLPVPALTLHDWLRLASDRQTMLYLGLAHTSEWATVSQKKTQTTISHYHLDALDQPERHPLEAAQVQFIVSGTEYLSLLNQVRLTD
ncbi:hypothetical protein [Lacticaseibacillus saniviri]